MTTREQIQEFELKLLDTRKELNTLIRTYQTSGEKEDRYIEYKCQALQAEINRMSQELKMVQTQQLERIAATQAVQAGQPIQTVQPQQSVQAVQPMQTVQLQQSVQAVPPMQTAQPRQTAQPQPVAQSSSGQTERLAQAVSPEKRNAGQANAGAAGMAQKQNKNVETTIGKTIMGVLASVLIFISLIFFATLFYPMLNDTIKMIVMYLVSGVFIAGGLISMKKTSHSKISLSIMGCGTGALYISLFVSSVYFQAFNEIVLYLLLLAWVVFVCVLSRMHSILFQIIGQIGILISTYFGFITCLTQQDGKKLILVAAFSIIASLGFYLSHKERLYPKNWLNHVFQLLWLVPLQVQTLFYQDLAPVRVVHGLLIAFYLFQLILAFSWHRLSEEHDDNMVFAILNTLYIILLHVSVTMMLMNVQSPADWWSWKVLIGCIVLITTVILLVATEKKFRGKVWCGGRIWLVMVAVMIGMVCSLFMEYVKDYASLIICAIPLLIYGFKTRSYLYKIAGMVCGGVFLVEYWMNQPAHLLLGIGLILFMGWLLVKEKEQYHIAYKAVMYPLIYSFLWVRGYKFFANVTNDNTALALFLTFAITSILHILAQKTRFAKNWHTGEPETGMKLELAVIHGILMLFSLGYIIQMQERPVYHILVILMTVLLFTINIANIYRYNKENHIGLGAYVGFKLTLLAVVVLISYSVQNYVISIVCFLLAIASIIIGFALRQKSFRIYGLVLSLISTVKLILIDMHYENTLGRALSFFACGALCFIISFIYHMIDRKIGKQYTDK